MTNKKAVQLQSDFQYVTRAELRAELLLLEERLEKKLEKKMHAILQEFMIAVGKKFDEIDVRLDRIEERLDKLETRVGNIEDIQRAQQESFQLLLTIAEKSNVTLVRHENVNERLRQLAAEQEERMQRYESILETHDRGLEKVQDKVVSIISGLKKHQITLV